jgi:hypothetical protein
MPADHDLPPAGAHGEQRDGVPPFNRPTVEKIKIKIRKIQKKQKIPKIQKKEIRY